MNYKHIFHAGNFADVIKHLVLIINLKQMLKKEKAFTVLDCFAGSGMYDLTSINANKTYENLLGIKKIDEFIVRESKNKLPPLLQEYISIITKSGNKDYYPGSPLIIEHYLRDIDTLIATELHPQEYLGLKTLFKGYKQISIHLLDAYLSIKSFLPFKTARGLIFIDPPFEVTNEYDKIIESLNIISKRANSISTIIWHPIKNLKKTELFYNNIKQLKFKEIFNVEFKLNSQIFKLPNKINYMDNCGLLIINPHDIKAELVEILEFVKTKIYNKEASFKVEFIKKIQL